MRLHRGWALVAGAVLLTAVPVSAAVALRGDERVPTGDYSQALTDRVAGMAAARSAALREPAQRVEPITLMLPEVKGKKKKSERGDRFVQVSATGSNDVPEAALRAYRNGAEAMASRAPGCALPWTLLAAIGRVESDHGRYGGSVLSSDGVSRPAILGLQLNGAGPVAAIRDTDDGKLDGDKVWDRAVGQMQFIPGTWSRVAADGDGDGRLSPNDLDDAALGAGRYLCAGGFSVAEPSGMARAIFSYNHSDYYVALVMAFERGYRTGVFVLPSPPPPPGAGDGLPTITRAKHRAPKKQSTQVKQVSTKKKKRPAGSGPSTPSPKPPPAPKPPTPTESPDPEPAEEPEPFHLDFDSAPINECGGDLCQAGRKLGLGPAGQLGRQAAHDYDGDGERESNTAELEGLVAAGSPVRLGYVMGDGVAQVYVVDGKDYRLEDGSFA